MVNVKLDDVNDKDALVYVVNQNDKLLKLLNTVNEKYKLTGIYCSIYIWKGETTGKPISMVCLLADGFDWSELDEILYKMYPSYDEQYNYEDYGFLISPANANADNDNHFINITDDVVLHANV